MDHSFIPVLILYVIVAGTIGKAAITQLEVTSGQTKDTKMLNGSDFSIGFATATKSFTL
jgi:hypothetical protein